MRKPCSYLIDEAANKDCKRDIQADGVEHALLSFKRLSVLIVFIEFACLLNPQQEASAGIILQGCRTPFSMVKLSLLMR